jgi:flagellar hook-basal body complex protein FliE
VAIAPIAGIGAAAGAAPTTGTGAVGGTTKSGGGFGHLLADAIQKLDATQVQAAKSSEAIATGQSQDISKVAMDIEEASLSLQLAVQVRNKVVDAYNDLFRMQI